MNDSAPMPGAAPALASLALCTLLSSLGMSSANIALPTLMNAFGATFQQVQWVILAYLLAVTSLIVSAGRLGDLLGHRRLLLAGLAVFSTASVVCGLAPGLSTLIAARAGQGLGAAVMMSLSMALVSQTVGGTRIGRAMGLLGTMSAVGTALGPALGGVLIDAFGWRAIFLVKLPLGLAALWLAMRHLPRDTRQARQARPSFDFPGMLLLAGTLAAYALSMTLGRGGFGPLNLVLLCGAALGAVLFVLAQLGAASPMLRLSMFRDRALSASLAMSMLVATVMMATLVIGPYYLARVFALAPASVGLVMSAGPIAAALAGVPAGRLVERFGAVPMAQAGVAGVAAGALALAQVPASAGIAGYLGCLLVMTVHFSLFQTANNSAVMAGVEPARRGVVSGVLHLSRNLGFISGASLMASLYATTGMQTTFTAGAAMAALAALIGLAALRR